MQEQVKRIAAMILLMSKTQMLIILKEIVLILRNISLKNLGMGLRMKAMNR